MVLKSGFHAVALQKGWSQLVVCYHVNGFTCAVGADSPQSSVLSAKCDRLTMPMTLLRKTQIYGRRWGQGWRVEDWGWAGLKGKMKLLCCVHANSLGVIIEMDVCRSAINRLDLWLMKRRRRR